ncbi:hypothetical protein PIB30_047467 [Stylosanthes scabra]|uniref:Uncharacterized protein n=1 Tax=Stylosanthes scabra TaxID=79078 RepID=A0ABU6ZFH2_9FABA|nr:hypothetical protein [Stylosanthes scabra]
MAIPEAHLCSNLNVAAKAMELEHVKEDTAQENCFLTLPVCGIQYAWNLGMASFRYSFLCIRCAHDQVHRLVSRMLKTLRGSYDDIGWLQHAPGMPPVQDGTSRFLELLAEIRSQQFCLNLKA